jgi:hypothetical protein
VPTGVRRARRRLLGFRYRYRFSTYSCSTCLIRGLATHRHQAHTHVCVCVCVCVCAFKYIYDIHSTWVAASLLITVVTALATVGKTFLAVRNTRLMIFLTKAHTSSVSTVLELSLSWSHQNTHMFARMCIIVVFRVVLVLDKHTHAHTCVFMYVCMYSEVSLSSTHFHTCVFSNV